MVNLSDLIKEENPVPPQEGPIMTKGPISHDAADDPETLHVYEEACHLVKEVLETVKSRGHFDPRLAMKLIENIVDAPPLLEGLYQKALQVRDLTDVFVHHSVNTAIFSLKMAPALNFKKEQLVHLGTAALLHEIGTTKVPEVILYKNSALTEEEFQILKKHPLYGYVIIMEQGKEFEWLAEIIYQEHEREKGQGYPRGLNSDEILEPAKVIGIVDVYDALINPRPQRKRFLPYTAVKMIIETQKRYFSPRIMKALLSQLSVFPLNCWVKLNNGMIGRVIETNPRQPLRPVVEIRYDNKGYRLKVGRVFNLSNSPLLYITNSLYEEELPQ